MAAMTANPAAQQAITALEADGVTTVIGTVVNPAGLTHAKTISVARLAAFADPGLGASPVWHVFAIDAAGVVVGGGHQPRRRRTDSDRPFGTARAR